MNFVARSMFKQLFILVFKTNRESCFLIGVLRNTAIPMFLLEGKPCHTLVEILCPVVFRIIRFDKVKVVSRTISTFICSISVPFSPSFGAVTNYVPSRGGAAEGFQKGTLGDGGGFSIK